MKTILVDAIYCFVLANGEIFEDMHMLLEQYPNRKILLTGADDGQFKKYNLERAPYELFTLKHNPEKTDPEYYRMMLVHFTLDATDVVYFEHDPEAVKSARSAGIAAYHYDSKKQDLAALKKFLDKNLS